MKRFFVDGIFLSKDKNENLLIEFSVGGMVHQFKVSAINAYKIAEVLQELFLKKN